MQRPTKPGRPLGRGGKMGGGKKRGVEKKGWDVAMIEGNLEIGN